MSETVPEGWKTSKIKDLALLEYGKSPSAVRDDNGYFPIIGTSGVVGKSIESLWDQRSVVLGRKGTINKPMYIDAPFWAIDTTYFCKISHDVDVKWFFYMTTQANLEKHNEASGVPSLSRDTLYSVRVSTPPLPEQKKIASILTSVDEVIENTQRQIDKLQELKKATMNELLTKGIGHTEFKDSELGRIPKSWEVKRLGDISEFRNGLNFSNKNKGVGLKIIGVSDFKDYEYPIYSDLDEINPEGIIREDDYLQENDFIFVRSNGNRNLIGRTLHIRGLEDNKITYSGFIIRCRINFAQEIFPDFCKYIFHSSLFKKKVHDAGAGTNISNLSQDLLSEIFFQLPPKEEQIRISKILNSMSASITDLQRELAKTQSLKKSLMQDLLTGKVRVQV